MYEYAPYCINILHCIQLYVYTIMHLYLHTIIPLSKNTCIREYQCASASMCYIGFESIGFERSLKVSDFESGPNKVKGAGRRRLGLESSIRMPQNRRQQVFKGTLVQLYSAIRK